MPGVHHLLINWFIMFAQMLTSVLRRDLNARSSPLVKTPSDHSLVFVMLDIFRTEIYVSVSSHKHTVK